MEVTERDRELLKSELSEALVKWSNGKLNESLARVMARKCIDNIDLNNPAFAHKGMNWYAKEIVNRLKM